MNYWKVVRELQRPKNMMVGLKSPLWVMKAAFDVDVVVPPWNIEFGEVTNVFQFVH